jgi:hypothetical protein
MSTTDPDILKRLQLSRQPKTKKEQQPIATRGEKLKELFKGYIKQVKAFLLRRPLCEIKAPGCKVQATCVHHTAGRTGEQLKNEEDWLPACAFCNLWAEINDAEARQKGFKKSKLGKVKKA